MTDETAPAEFPACPVQGHDHPLGSVQVHVQQGTGQVAHTLECPGGAYRFFHIPGVSDPAKLRVTMRRRPRWGWAGETRPANRTAPVCHGCHQAMPLAGACENC